MRPHPLLTVFFLLLFLILSIQESIAFDFFFSKKKYLENYAKVNIIRKTVPFLEFTMRDNQSLVETWLYSL